ncbi:unnamed protein product [Vicia faba]|uniref:RRM domain-containing protein n=1 Tax=Vicia faba TaxID=3906 RepID=A0AAV0Z5H8_VICFA|nr:unnamed protein product [Vicia faba]
MAAPFRRPSKPLKNKTTPNPNPNPNPKPAPISNPLRNPFHSSNSLTNKLWLTSKLSPPPPPPPLPYKPQEDEVEGESSDDRTQFRQPGKIFVGNLPGWVKKQAVSEFFRQFGLIKNRDFDQRPWNSTVLTVKLDDGKKWKEKMLEREKWLHGNHDKDYRSMWHEERDGSRKEFQKVMETHPENWQEVVCAFERINKFCCGICCITFNLVRKVPCVEFFSR